MLLSRLYFRFYCVKWDELTLPAANSNSTFTYAVLHQSDIAHCLHCTQRQIDMGRTNGNGNKHQLDYCCVAHLSSRFCSGWLSWIFIIQMWTKSITISASHFSWFRRQKTISNVCFWIVLRQLKVKRNFSRIETVGCRDLFCKI